MDEGHFTECVTAVKLWIRLVSCTTVVMCRISSRNAPIWTNVESLYNKLVKYNTHAHTQHQQNTNVASTKLTRETKQNTHDNTNQCIRYILADWSQHDSKMWPVLHVCSISQSSFPKAAFTPDTFSWIQVCRTSNLYPSTGWWIQVLSSVLLADTSGYMSPWRQFCRDTDGDKGYKWIQLVSGLHVSGAKRGITPSNTPRWQFGIVALVLIDVCTWCAPDH